MSLIHPPSRFVTRSLSRSPTLWTGCVGMFVPAVGPTGLTLFDVANRGAANGVGTVNGGNYAWVAGGLQTGPESGSYVDLGAFPGLEGLGGLTVLAYVKPLVVSSSWSVEDGVAGNVSSSGNELFLMRFDDGDAGEGPGQVQVGLETTTVDVGADYSTIACGSIKDEWHVMGIRANADLTFAAVYDGRLGVTKSPAGAWKTGAYGDNFWVGGTGPGSSTDMFDGVIAWIGFWVRALIQNELRTIAADPFAMFRSRRRVFKAPVAGGVDLRSGNMAGGLHVLTGGLQ